MPLSPTLLLPTPKPTLTRTQLLAKLDHYAHQHLTVLNAKRGFGKRSIIDDWITSRALTCLSFDFTEPPNALSTNEPLNQTDRLWQTLTSQAQNILNIAHTAPTLKGFCNAIQNHLPPIENKEATTAPSTPSTHRDHSARLST